MTADTPTKQRRHPEHVLSAAQWETTLRQYVFPCLSAQLVHTITTADILAVLAPIWYEQAGTLCRERLKATSYLALNPSLGHSFS